MPPRCFELFSGVSLDGLHRSAYWQHGDTNFGHPHARIDHCLYTLQISLYFFFKNNCLNVYRTIVQQRVTVQLRSANKRDVWRSPATLSSSHATPRLNPGRWRAMIKSRLVIPNKTSKKARCWTKEVRKTPVCLFSFAL